MGGWVRAHVHFGVPLARLYVGRDQQLLGGLVGEVVERHEDDPAALEVALRAVILAHRPELAGGSLVAARFDFEHGCWEFLYSHPSLGRAAAGDVVERVPLVAGEGDPKPDVVGWRTRPGVL